MNPKPTRSHEATRDILQENLLMIGPKTGETVMGVSLAFDMLADHLKQQHQSVTEVNLTQAGETQAAGRMSLNRALFTLIKVFEAWFKMLFVRKVYIIISTSAVGFYRDFLMVFGAWVLRKKILIHLHGGGYRLFYQESGRNRQALIRWMLRRVHTIIVLGEILKSQFEFLDSPEKIRVVPNGLPQPTSKNFTSQIKNRPGPGEPWRVLYLSNLMETKGYYVLLDAIENLIEEHNPEIQVDFCGGFVQSVAESSGGDPARNLPELFRKRISASPLAGKVRYHGTVSGVDKDRMLEQAHVLVLPTWYPWEGQPLSIIEAMAYGTPVISTEHAGIPEQIVHNQTGWMLPANQINAEQLSRFLSQLIHLSPTDYQAMSAAAIEFYQHNFTRERHLARMLEVINAC